ncbi:isocitrate lyase/PEP mutase family protein [Deinococcus roseus]|uniref:2-methylisocitrate lyase n=1 Tax=Deinococcus roseus TaxID=392414 RepID=A0ABQ2D1X4_9DEIO|nr:isocitrate lyase/phosphoenolpyruvate mutase family protein [Deinococcus roseus]GGJ42339.1 hypothetical protein GCM10008938_30580 [Deinococcus roseus]
MTHDAFIQQQILKGQQFKALHEAPGILVTPNPWDAGTARILTALGFKALSTTSAGLAYTLGVQDCTAGFSREQNILNARAVADATHLPVAADLENGYGDRPEDAAETLRLSALEGGMVGGSIEDATTRPEKPIYDFQLSVERVAAAAEAARALPFPFTFVARAENFLHGVRDLDDTIRRLQAYEQAGADVLFAPGLRSLEEIKLICQAIKKPVNVNAGSKGFPHSVADLQQVGVKRVSLGGGLAKAALAAFTRAAIEVQEHGTVDFLAAAHAVDFAELMYREHQNA